MISILGFGTIHHHQPSTININSYEKGWLNHQHHFNKINRIIDVKWFFLSLTIPMDYFVKMILSATARCI